MRNILIRLIADCIYLIHRGAFLATPPRFIVFTGTSGKTLARFATTHALRSAGATVVSPPLGYTNELGLVLAAIGIESVRLTSLAGVRSILRARPDSSAYICIELGADWRYDIPWFLNRFTPHGVCITTTTKTEWTRELGDIWADKQLLVRQIPPGGFVCWSSKNESADVVRTLQIPEHITAVEFTDASPSEGLPGTQSALVAATQLLKMLF
jgi:hypothetical protein